MRDEGTSVSQDEVLGVGGYPITQTGVTAALGRGDGPWRLERP